MKDDKKTITDYLNEREIRLPSLSKHFKTGINADRSFHPFKVENSDYAVDHFFDESDNIGFGLICTNSVLNLDSTNQLAIALVEGDDVICMNTEDYSINLWLIQTGQGQRITIADSIDDFIQKCVL